MTGEGVDGRRSSAGAPGAGRSVLSPFRIIVAVVLLAAGAVAWQFTRPSGATYRTAMVSTGTAVSTLSSVGTITPANQASLNFDVAGTVSAVDVAVGQQVTAGQTVASLDATSLQNAEVTAQASLAAAQATLASDEAGSGGASSGTGGSSSSSSSRTKVVTAQALALDQANVDVAQANLDSAQQALTSANLVSTISGTVGQVSLTVGSSVSAGSSSSSGEVVIVGTGDSYEVAGTVPVASISKVAVGQQALVTPDSSSKAIPGTVTGIGVLATSGSTSTTYPVTVSIDSPSLGLFSGGEAGISIVTGKAVGVTTVPTSAVHTVGTTSYVTVVNGTTTKQVKVVAGTVGAVLTQIKSGVTSGQRVSIANLDQPVPSSSTTNTTGLGGFGGTTGFGGGAGGFGGGGGGGFGGGGAAGG